MVHPYNKRDSNSTRPVIAFETPIEIHDDTWIGKVEPDLREAIMDACDPAGEEFRPSRVYGSPYGFYRRNAPAEDNERLAFDSDCRLRACVALSRLVHPTAIDFQYAARVICWPNGARKIVPFRETHLNPQAFVVDLNENWLIPDDIPSLRDLVLAFETKKPGGRVMSALWYREAAARNYYVDIRWLFLTVGLEALVHIEGEKLSNGKSAGSTKVFVDRFLALGALDPALSVSEDDLRAMYRQRSGLAHGQRFGALDETRKNLYRRQERLVSEAAKKALLDDSFAAIFESDASIAANLPLNA